MVRTCSVDEKGLKKGTWTEEEDRKLKSYIEKYGHWNWRQLPKFAGVARCGKSCRLRWMNYLRPGLKRGNYTKEEEDLIIQLHAKHGNKWSAIASKLQGRTDNEIKNHWHTNLKRRRLLIKPSKDTYNIGVSSETANIVTGDKNGGGGGVQSQTNDHDQFPQISSSDQMEITSLSPTSSTMSTTESSSHMPAPAAVDHEISSFADSIESFWSEPFILDTSYYNYNDLIQDSSSLSSSVVMFNEEEGFVSFNSHHIFE